MRTTLLVTAACLAIGLIVPSIAVSQDKPADQAAPAAATDRKTADQASPAAATDAKKITPEQMMEAMQKYGTPGKEHEALKPLVGTFDSDVSMQMSPTDPPMTSKGKTVNESIFDGRYIKSDYKGDMMGAPFQGLGLMGYDKMKQKYTSLWADSMSTALMLSEGTADSSGKTITYSCTYDCPITNEKKTSRQVMTIVDNDHHTFEMYDKGADGKEFKTMTIKYTRAK